MRCCLTLQLFHVQKNPPKSPKLFYAVRASWHPSELWSIHPIMEEHFSNHPSPPPPLPPPQLKLSPAAIETYRAAQNSRKSRQALEQMKVRWMTGGIRRMGGAAEGGRDQTTQPWKTDRDTAWREGEVSATKLRRGYRLWSTQPQPRTASRAPSQSEGFFSLSFKRRSGGKPLFFFFASFAAYSLVGLEDQQTLWGPAPTWSGGKLWITA